MAQIANALSTHRKYANCWTILTPEIEPSNIELSVKSSGTRLPEKTGAVPTGIQRMENAENLFTCFAPAARRLVALPEKNVERNREKVRNLDYAAAMLHPKCNGTASAVLMALTHVIFRDRKATVVINPMESSATTDLSILNAVADATGIVERISGKAILLAEETIADVPNSVWIQPGQKYRESLCENLWTVKRMTSDPNPFNLQPGATGERLRYKSIVVAKAALIWKLGLWCMPEIASSQAWILDDDCDIPLEEERLGQPIFRSMGVRSFTKDLLMRVTRHLAVMKIPNAQ